MAQYASPKNDTPIFNPKEFVALVTTTAESGDIAGIQEEIDNLNDELTVLETSLSTIGLANVTLTNTTQYLYIGTNVEFNLMALTLSPGVYIIKMMIIAAVSSGSSLSTLYSYFRIGTSTTRNQTGGQYNQNVNGSVLNMTFVQQFIINVTAQAVYNFCAVGVLGQGSSKIQFNVANYNSLGPGSPISLMRIR
jgi:hypothetical protein